MTTRRDLTEDDWQVCVEEYLEEGGSMVAYATIGRIDVSKLRRLVAKERRRR